MAAPHRFFVDRDAVDGGGVATLRGDQARQIATVLRLAQGTEIVLVADGEDVAVRLDHVGSDRVTGTVLSRSANRAEPALSLTLALPLLRGDHSEEVLEAVTQLGVARVVPFVSERSVAQELSSSKRARWERIAREAAETARRGRVPEIGPLAHWSDLFDTLEPPVIVAWEGERNEALAAHVDPSSDALSVVIGPEGGLSENEVDLARRAGATVVSLGPRNLRSETAAIAAVAVLLTKR